MTCWRGCCNGFRRVDEVPGDTLTEGDILLHLERCRMLGVRSKVRPCPCRGRVDPADRGLFDDLTIEEGYETWPA